MKQGLSVRTWQGNAERQRQITLTCLNPSQDELVSGRVAANFPTRVVFVYEAKTLQEVKKVNEAYFEN